MKKILFIILILVFTAGISSAVEVNIIMKDGSVVKGNMLGKTADEIYLQGDNGKASTMKITDIKAVFNAGNGEPVVLTARTDSQQVLTNGQTVTNDKNSIVVSEIQGTGVYYGDYNGDVVYYYGGAWWKYTGGLWYRAYGFDGPWFFIGGSFIPYPVAYIGPRWFYYGPRHIYYRHWRRW